MGRQLRNFGVAALLMSLSAQASASSLEDWIRRLTNPPETLTLTSTRVESPSVKITPMLISFKGVVKIPSYLTLQSGMPRVHNVAAQLIIDGNLICNYSPRSIIDRYYVLKSCSDGSRSGEEVDVRNKIEVSLNYSNSSKATLVAKVVVVRTEESSYGINFPYIKATKGQILTYNGEAWVPGDVADLDLADGTQGEQGEMGPQGPMGPAGANGAAGIAGTPGVKGDKGDKGEKGDKGDRGEKGEAGSAGAAGSVGATGAIGPQGPAGVAGSVGATGAIGPQGPAGPAGSVGAIGPQGPAGAAGAVGATGATGPQGPRGEAGSNGTQGSKGDTGATGAMGPMGPQGPAGLAGANGADGINGANGTNGAPGAKGDKGEKGDRGLSEIAYLRDERASGVAGGTCTSTGWDSRVLNTLGGDSGFITLANNRFTLTPGKYFIEIVAPAFGVNQHQAKLKVIETNQDVMFGTNASSHASSPSGTTSIIMGEIIIEAASTFEIQHRCLGAKGTTGLGAPANFGSPEIYTQVKIIKKQ